MPAHPLRLSHEFSGTLRTFGFWMANRTIGHPLLEGVPYIEAMLDSPSLMEMAFAIFANVIEFDEDGVPINAKWAEHRAAQFVRNWCDPSYVVAPPFEDWEQELYGPPSLPDRKPWPDGSS